MLSRVASYAVKAPIAANHVAGSARNASTDAAAAKPKLAIIFYTTYGHVGALADAIYEGASKVEGIEITKHQVAETLPDSILKAIHAPPKPNVPVLGSLELANYDAFLFGFPTRYGIMPSQMKAMFDGTGSLWAKGALAGKPAGLFFSTGTQGGGQETTALTTLPFLTHHGMIYVPMGYGAPHMMNMTEIRGGSAWGPGTFAGDGSRQVSQVELEHARYYGEQFAKVAKDLYEGRKLRASKL